MKKSFTQSILDKLPRDYLIGAEDVRWLDIVGKFHKGATITPESATVAVREAEKHQNKTGGWIFCDPFELLVDTGLYCKRLDQ